MTTATKTKKSKGETTATEAALLNEVTAPVVAAEQEEQTAQEAPAAPVETQPSDETADETDADEGDPVEEARAAASKLLNRIYATARNAEASAAVAWLTIGNQAIEYVKIRLSVGHSFEDVLQTIKAKLSEFDSYGSDPGRLMSAGAVWSIYCETKGIADDSKRQKEILSKVVWRHWWNVFQSLATRSVVKEGKENYSLTYSLLPHVEERIIGLITDAAEKGFGPTTIGEKAAEIRGDSYRVTSEEAKRIKDEEAKREQEARAAEMKSRQEKDAAEKREKEAAAEKERLEKEAKDKQEEANKIREAAEDEDDETAQDEANERAAIMEVEAEAAKKAAQEAKEREEKERQEKEAAAKKATEERQTIEEAKKTKEQAQRVADQADKQVEKIKDEAQKRAARVNGETTKKTERKEDKGPNMLDVARTAKPSDLAGMLFAMMKANQMPGAVLKEFIAMLDSKDGAALFAADQTSKEVITAAVVAYEECAEEGAK
jgi:hypothetical protein